MVSSVWIFQRAFSVGAFLDGVDCSFHASVVMQETCDDLANFIGPYITDFEPDLSRCYFEGFSKPCGSIDTPAGTVTGAN